MSRYCFVALLIQTLVVFALGAAADAAGPAELEFVESGGTDDQWTTIAVIDYGASPPPRPARRHLFRFAKVTATGLRIITDRNERKATHLLAIDELEVYGPDAELPAGDRGGWQPVLLDPDSLPPPWKSPLVKKGKLNSPLVEVTPFVCGGRYYMLENWRNGWDVPESPCTDRNAEELWIRDVEAAKYVSRALAGHLLGTAFVWDQRVYAFATKSLKGAKKSA